METEHTGKKNIFEYKKTGNKNITKAVLKT